MNDNVVLLPTFRDISRSAMRRTKEDALLTREKLLDTAELLFAERGVSHTSLQDIAQAAGLTRGAVYWHFKDKGDVFNAMMDRAVLPMEEALADLTTRPHDNPLQQVRHALLGALQLIAEDARTRRVFDIATRKVEFVNELSSVRERHLAVHLRCRQHIEGAIQLAQARGLIALEPCARSVAVGLTATVHGLIDLWMLEPTLFPLVASGQQAVDLYLAGLRPGLVTSGTEAATAPSVTSSSAGASSR